MRPTESVTVTSYSVEETRDNDSTPEPSRTKSDSNKSETGEEKPKRHVKSSEPVRKIPEDGIENSLEESERRLTDDK